MLRMAADARQKECERLHAHARSLVDAGRLLEAEAALRNLLTQAPDNAQWWYELGLLHSKQARLQEAISALMRSVELDPAAVSRVFELGAMLESLNDSGAAMREYLGGLPVGHRLILQHRVPDAIEAYEAAYRLHPEDAAVTRTLASALRLTGQPGRAALLLGHAAYRDQRYSNAIAEFTTAVNLGCVDATAHAELAGALGEKGRYAEAIDVARAGIALYPDEPGGHRWLARALASENRTEEAIAVAAAAATSLSTPSFLAAERHLSLPIVYDTVEQIGQWRSRLREGLRQMDAAALSRDNISPNFLLGYQGLDDLPLQREHGTLIRRIMSASCPQWAEAQSTTPVGANRRIRVGYVFTGNIGIDPLFLGWMSEHDASGFDVVAYQVGGTVDPLSYYFKTAVSHFRHLPNELEPVCQRIADDRLDVLVFFYIGMSSLVSQLAGLRLAPVQCAAWGHPITTGLPTMDYFISNEMMEPDNGDAHYSEKLVRLPGLGVSLPPPFLPPLVTPRSEFGLPEDAVVYLSIQAASKYLPQYDDVLPAICRRVPNALVVMMERSAAQVMDVLKRRMRGAFARVGLDSERFIRYLPEQEYYPYLDLLQRADVFLDTLGWSGGLTTIDAVTCGLPVVTWPGEFMRGRQSTGILRQMGVVETIAGSVDDYVDIAVRLGREPDWRRQISMDLRNSQGRLFGDRTWQPSLEDFYRRSVRERDGDLRA